MSRSLPWTKCSRKRLGTQRTEEEPRAASGEMDFLASIWRGPQVSGGQGTALCPAGPRMSHRVQQPRVPSALWAPEQSCSPVQAPATGPLASGFLTAPGVLSVCLLGWCLVWPEREVTRECPLVICEMALSPCCARGRPPAGGGLFPAPPEDPAGRI